MLGANEGTVHTRAGQGEQTSGCLNHILVFRKYLPKPCPEFTTHTWIFLAFCPKEHPPLLTSTADPKYIFVLVIVTLGFRNDMQASSGTDWMRGTCPPGRVAPKVADRKSKESRARVRVTPSSIVEYNREIDPEST